MTTEIDKTDSCERLAYRTYLDEHRSLVDAEVDVAGRFDKGLLTISGGTLLLSMTFVKDIASKPHHTWTLFVSWMLLAITTCAMLTSLLTSQSALRHQRGILDAMLDGGGDPSGRNWFARQTNVLNVASIASFVAALVFLSVFVYANTPGD